MESQREGWSRHLQSHVPHWQGSRAKLQPACCRPSSSDQEHLRVKRNSRFMLVVLTAEHGAGVLLALAKNPATSRSCSTLPGLLGPMLPRLLALPT